MKNECKYLNGKKNGPWRWYDENGALLENGEFKNGDKTGQWKFYDEKGNLTETRNYG
ncbi:MORN repeat variant [compost metagenome]